MCGVCAVSLCGGFVRSVCAVSLCGESFWAIIYVEHLLGESHFSFVRCLCGVCAEPLCATGLCFVLRRKISCTNTLHKHPAQTPCTNTRHKHRHKHLHKHPAQTPAQTNLLYSILFNHINHCIRLRAGWAGVKFTVRFTTNRIIDNII